MTSEIRVNKLTNRIGLSTVTFADSGIGVTVTGRIDPDTDSARDLGTSSVRWRNAYVDTYYGDGSNLTGIAGVSLSNGSNNRVVTATGASALTGESNLTFTGSILTITNSGGASEITLVTPSGNDSGVYFNDGSNAGALTYNHSDNSMRFRVNSTEKVRIDSAGRVMIGTTTEGNGNADEFTISYINHAGVSGGDQGRCGMTIRSGDNTSGVTQNGYIYFSDGTSGANESMGVVAYEHSTDSMYFSTAQVARLRIDQNGSIGINVQNPGAYDPNAESLVIGEISGGDGHAGMTIVSSATDKQGSIYFADGTASASYRGRIEYKHSNDSLCLGAAGSGDKLVIDSSGNVIIRGSSLNNSSVNGQALQIQGTTRPTLILRGNASGGNTCEIQFADNSGADNDSGVRVGLIKYEHAGTYADHMHFHTSGTERVVISHSGRFGIANSPAELASFAENLQVTGLYGNNYAAAFKIKQSSGSLMRFATWVNASSSFQLCGGITVNGTSTSFNTSSDYRLKENDVKISDGITRVKQLRPIRFNWKSDPSSTEDGFFAHEVSPIVPESVSGEKDATIDEIGEGYQKIDHSKLVPLLTAALQEAITKIEKLEQDSVALRARVTNLEGN